jgi:Protein kinase domain
MTAALDPHGSPPRFNVTVETAPHMSSTVVVTPTTVGGSSSGGLGLGENSVGVSRSGKSRFKPLKQPLDPAVCSKAARYAVRVYDEMSKRSHLLAEDSATSLHSVPLFDRDDILPRLGELLGKGGFNSVYELRTSTLPGLPPLCDVRTAGQQQQQQQPQQPQQPSSGSHAATAPQTPPGSTSSSPPPPPPPTYSNRQLAVKFLSDDAMMVPEEFCNGAADLLMEAKYLTALAAHPHPSLIQLHGVCSAGPSGFSLADRAGFFLVIDRLYDTLGRRMDVWRELTRRRAGQGRVLQAMFLQRLMVAQDIASALRHLHKLNVVFRDLKPDNVGFDYAGAVKIFDFGLAKELDPKQKTESGMYKVRTTKCRNDAVRVSVFDTAQAY